MKKSMRIGLASLSGVFSVCIVLGCSNASMGAGKKGLSIEDAMKKGFKGKDKSLYAIVSTGRGSPDQKKLLVELTEALAANTPEKGDKADWQKRTDALVAAAKMVQNGDPKGLTTLKAAANCKACHELHRES